MKRRPTQGSKVDVQAVREQRELDRLERSRERAIHEAYAAEKRLDALHARALREDRRRGNDRPPK